MEFITNKHNYSQFVSDAPFTAASLGNRLYVAFQPKGTTLLKILAFSDNGGASKANEFTSPTDGYKFPCIVNHRDSLYVAFTGTNTQLNIVQVQLDGNGYPTTLVNKRDSAQTSVVGAMLSTTPTGLVIVWPGKNDGAQLNIGSVVGSD